MEEVEKLCDIISDYSGKRLVANSVHEFADYMLTDEFFDDFKKYLQRPENLDYKIKIMEYEPVSLALTKFVSNPLLNDETVNKISRKFKGKFLNFPPHYNRTTFKTLVVYFMFETKQYARFDRFLYDDGKDIHGIIFHVGCVAIKQGNVELLRYLDKNPDFKCDFSSRKNGSGLYEK
jgi:hypothetical protein